MKLEIYEPLENRAQKEEPVRLKFKQSGSDIIVGVVNENGLAVDRGNLLIFSQTGRIYLCGNVNPLLGFELDGHTHIIVENL